MDPYLVVSVMKAESKFSPQARSVKGALGLMQIMPDTGMWVAEQLDCYGYNNVLFVGYEL